MSYIYANYEAIDTTVFISYNFINIPDELMDKYKNLKKCIHNIYTKCCYLKLSLDIYGYNSIMREVTTFVFKTNVLSLVMRLPSS